MVFKDYAIGIGIVIAKWSKRVYTGLGFYNSAIDFNKILIRTYPHYKKKKFKNKKKRCLYIGVLDIS